MRTNPEGGGGAADRVYNAIAAGSRYATYLTIIAMLLVMCAEVVMRYLAGSPLGWNISLIEKVLLPGMVFLGLPWSYAIGAHVTADMVYDRLPASARSVCRLVTFVLLVACAAMLTYAGARLAIDAYELGSIPPPLSSQLPIPTWIWRSLMPLGSALMIVLLLIDARRFLQPEREATS